MKQKSDMKIGIVVGDSYGHGIFETEVTDPAKALREANEFISQKYNPPVELGLINQHKRKRGGR